MDELQAMHGSVRRFLKSPPYYPCLLIAHPDIGRLASVADELASAYGWPRLPVGKALSEALLCEPPSRYSVASQRWLNAQATLFSPGPALCTEIDLLFEPELGLDPLALLRQASRVSKLVVMWPGSFAAGVVTYAVPGHMRYRAWREPEVAVHSLS
ncbi:MAG: BREX-3 system P-loop-containing protein BrxF [Chloroflexota bacterium]|nr:BREX-3 system P-loop-containing protein BrxF [Chloroflexota bacterium]